MTYIVADRVKQKTTTVGTSTFTIGASITGFQTFASVSNTGDTFHYAAVHLTDGNWETGLGTINTGSGTIARTPLTSSNNNALVSFASGDKEIFITPVSSNLIYKTDQGGVGGSIIRTTTIDFGNTSTFGIITTATDLAAFTTSKIEAVASPSTANGALGGDEYECDGLMISAQCLTNGVITFYTSARPGPVSGKRNINYIIS